jgi:hypothetical protein
VHSARGSRAGSSNDRQWSGSYIALNIRIAGVGLSLEIKSPDGASRLWRPYAQDGKILRALLL